MSAQCLSAKSCRRIARGTGQEVLRAWSHGGYVFNFVTPDHRHGWYDKKSGDWGWSTGKILHYTSCSETWPEG